MINAVWGFRVGNNSGPTVENLTPWPKGVSGNPAGRPKGSRSRQSIYKQWLEITPEGADKENADMVAIAMIEKAKAGDVNAAKEVFDSGYGKTADVIDHKSSDKSMSPAASRLADFLSRKKPDASQA